MSRYLPPDDVLQKWIAAKIADGRLPRDRLLQTWGASAMSGPCDGCDEPIDPPGYSMQAQGTGSKRWRFHVTCFYLWDELRRTLAEEPPTH